MIIQNSYKPQTAKCKSPETRNSATQNSKVAAALKTNNPTLQTPEPQANLNTPPQLCVQLRRPYNA